MLLNILALWIIQTELKRDQDRDKIALNDIMLKFSHMTTLPVPLALDRSRFWSHWRSVWLTH